MTELRDRIVLLRDKGLSYREIQASLGCSRSTISYYLSPTEKEKTQARIRKRRASATLGRKTDGFRETPPAVPPREAVSTQSHRLRSKMQRFHEAPSGEEVSTSTYYFTSVDVLDRAGDEPRCYLTGDRLDLSDVSTYSFDHIVPRSRGGENTLENLGLTTPLANRMKTDMTVEELLDMCEKVLQHHGRL